MIGKNQHQSSTRGNLKRHIEVHHRGVFWKSSIDERTNAVELEVLCLDDE